MDASVAVPRRSVCTKTEQTLLSFAVAVSPPALGSHVPVVSHRMFSPSPAVTSASVAAPRRSAPTRPRKPLRTPRQQPVQQRQGRQGPSCAASPLPSSWQQQPAAALSRRGWWGLGVVIRAIRAQPCLASLRLRRLLVVMGRVREGRRSRRGRNSSPQRSSCRAVRGRATGGGLFFAVASGPLDWLMSSVAQAVRDSKSRVFQKCCSA